MENAVRSRRTRDAALQAALTIITRDGPARLTIDAIARESGISKGGVLHQFRTKEAVLKALMEYQIEKTDAFFHDYLGQIPPTHKEPLLEAQIATFRTAATHPQSTTFAIAGAMGEAPDLLAAIREDEAKRVETMMQEAADPKVALVRWSAAKGLALAALLGLCPLSEQDRNALFDYIQDGSHWTAPTPPRGRRRKAARPRPRKAD